MAKGSFPSHGSRRAPQAPAVLRKTPGLTGPHRADGAVEPGRLAASASPLCLHEPTADATMPSSLPARRELGIGVSGRRDELLCRRQPTAQCVPPAGRPPALRPGLLGEAGTSPRPLT